MEHGLNKWQLDRAIKFKGKSLIGILRLIDEKAADQEAILTFFTVAKHIEELILLSKHIPEADKLQMIKEHLEMIEEFRVVANRYMKRLKK